MNLGAQPAEAVAARLKSRPRRSRVVGTAAVTVAMASMGLVGSAAANAAPGQLASAFRGLTSSELGGSTKVAILQGKMVFVEDPASVPSVGSTGSLNPQ